jgi:hypothetical protein
VRLRYETVTFGSYIMDARPAAGTMFQETVKSRKAGDISRPKWNKCAIELLEMVPRLR